MALAMQIQATGVPDHASASYPALSSGNSVGTLRMRARVGSGGLPQIVPATVEEKVALSALFACAERLTPQGKVPLGVVLY